MIVGIKKGGRSREKGGDGGRKNGNGENGVAIKVWSISGQNGIIRDSYSVRYVGKYDRNQKSECVGLESSKRNGRKCNCFSFFFPPSFSCFASL